MTLLELMAVVTIIGVFMVLAKPSITGTLANRQAGRAAEEVAGVFRYARSRASATGAAHLVRVTTTTTNADTFTLMAAVNAAGAPTATCGDPTWGTAGSSVTLSTLSLSAGSFAGKDISVAGGSIDPAGAATGALADYCYAPGGALWIRPSGGGIFQRPSGAARIQYSFVWNPGASSGALGLTRFVSFSPTGVPRIEAR